ncbi:hypothetical protein ABH930_000007 [Kitasatospora sp. GAS204A]|uniref:hypothetical protein n=1 Tax=unclassified Kitasatospora TaxID=2633591 RepID=UPI002474AD4D|nr:hypothetical protein [Kitasatospora sp. GAS204B]MDH6121227.1 hypothetical protein [Kitasatospora sp. GAS204B]
MRIVRIAAALTGSALLIGSLAACGSSAKSSTGATGGNAGAPALPDLGPKAELVAAAAVMQKAGSADVALTSAGGSSGSGSGVYAWSGKPALDLSEQQSGKTIKFRAVDGSSYLGVDDTQAATVGGKHWLDLTTSSGAAGMGDPFTALAVLMNPAAELTVAAQNGTLSKVGSEQLAGTGTTHYRSSMPAQSLVDQLPNLTDAQRKAALQVATSGGATVITDFWVDGKHQLVQMQEQTSDGSSPSSGAGGSSASTVKYSNLGVKVSVSPPAASDQAAPADALKLLSSLG